MKRAVRNILFTILLFAGIGMLVNYFFSKRQLQEHAQCIPANSFLVLTLNVKELYLETQSQQNNSQNVFNSILFSKELKPLFDAIVNDNSGVNKTGDILGFMYQSGDAAYLGITISVNNQEQISNLVKDKLSKSNFSFLALENYKVHLLQLDTTSAILGWNDKSLMLLYPFGNSTAKETADECEKLLSQAKEKSILSNENFCKEQLNSFDANIWIHASPLLAFSGGGNFFKTHLDGVDYLNMNVEFRNGEIDIRKIVTTDGRENKIPKNLIITGDAKNVLGFIRMPMNLEDKDLIHSYLRTSPLSELPFDEEQMQKLLSTFDGNSSILFHDTLTRTILIGVNDESHDTSYGGYANEGIPQKNAMSYCFGLKNEVEAKKIFTEIALADSFPFSNAHWEYFDLGLKTKFFIADNVLTMTTDPSSDGKPRAVPDQWEGMELQLDLGNYFLNSDDDLFYFDPNPKYLKQLLGNNFGSMTISKAAIESNKESSTVILRMKDKKTNSLVQLENLAEKLMIENHFPN